MGKIIITFDVISVNRREIKLTGDTNKIYKICNPTKQMQTKAKKSDVIAVIVDEIDSNNIITTKEVMTLRELQTTGI